MNMLSISSDRAMLKQNSGAQNKAIWLAGAFEHTHVVMFTTARDLETQISLSDKLTVYPTRSLHPLLYVFDAWRIGRKIIKEHAVDAITCQDPFLSGLVGVWLKNKTLPLQIQIHTDISSPIFQTKSLAHRIRMMIAGYVLPRCDLVRSVSVRVKEYIKQKYGNIQTTVLPVWINLPGIRQERELLNLKQQYQAKHIIVTASRLEQEKNVDHIIQAFTQLHEAHSESVLLVIGSGSLERSLKKQVSESGVQNGIHFISWSEDLPAYLHESDVYVSASDYEGFGLSLVEAALCGNKIVSTRVGVIGNELSKNVWIADSPQRLGEVLRQAVGADRDETIVEQAEELCINKDKYLKRYREAFVIK